MVKAFVELGDAQRGKPESMMLRLQEAAGGGVLSFCAEHIGDLTHRMSHMVGWEHYPSAGYGYVDDKVAKTYRMLTNSYGFEREMEQNFKNNAEYRHVPLDEFRKKVDVALRNYAEAHKQLKVYNHAQWLAREAAIRLGQQRWQGTINCLEQLKKMLVSEEKWSEEALKYTMKDGVLQEYHHAG